MKETKYDNKYKPSLEEINSFPDLQNGPSNLIKGSDVAIQQVGTHNFKLPLKYKKQNGEDVVLETKVNQNCFFRSWEERN